MNYELLNSKYKNKTEQINLFPTLQEESSKHEQEEDKFSEQKENSFIMKYKTLEKQNLSVFDVNSDLKKQLLDCQIENDSLNSAVKLLENKLGLCKTKLNVKEGENEMLKKENRFLISQIEKIKIENNEYSKKLKEIIENKEIKLKSNEQFFEVKDDKKEKEYAGKIEYYKELYEEQKKIITYKDKLIEELNREKLKLNDININLNQVINSKKEDIKANLIDSEELINNQIDNINYLKSQLSLKEEIVKQANENEIKLKEELDNTNIKLKTLKNSYSNLQCTVDDLQEQIQFKEQKNLDLKEKLRLTETLKNELLVNQSLNDGLKTKLNQVNHENKSLKEENLFLQEAIFNLDVKQKQDKINLENSYKEKDYIENKGYKEIKKLLERVELEKEHLLYENFLLNQNSNQKDITFGGCGLSGLSVISGSQTVDKVHFEEVSKQLKLLESDNYILNTEVQILTNKTSTLEENLKLLQNKKDKQSNLITCLNSQIQNLENEIKDLTSTLITKDNIIFKLSEDLHSIKFNQIQSQIPIEVKQEKSNLYLLLQDKDKQICELQSTIDTLRLQLSTITEKNQYLQREINEIESDLRQLKEKYDKSKKLLNVNRFETFSNINK